MMTSDLKTRVRGAKALDMSKHTRSAPIADWLDVTCAPDNSFMSEVEDWLDSQCFSCEQYEKGHATVYRLNDGVLRLERCKVFHRFSASGGILALFRAMDVVVHVIRMLSSVPHTITRLDVAVDVLVDAPKVLSTLRKVYRSGLFSFGRKSLRTTWISSVRMSDGVDTGTWYVGHRSSARVTAKVYDKQNQMYEAKGVLIEPTTRYELTFKKGYGCTLFDVLYPVDVFYSHCEGLLDVPPCSVEPWVPSRALNWVSSHKREEMYIGKFLQGLEYDAELLRTIDKVVALGGANAEGVFLAKISELYQSRLAQSETPEDAEHA